MVHPERQLAEQAVTWPGSLKALEQGVTGAAGPGAMATLKRGNIVSQEAHTLPPDESHGLTGGVAIVW